MERTDALTLKVRIANFGRHKPAVSSASCKKVSFCLKAIHVFLSLLVQRKEQRKHSRFSCLRAFGGQGCGTFPMLSISSAKIGDEKLNFSAHLQWNIMQGGMNSFCSIPDADRGNQADHWQISSRR